MSFINGLNLVLRAAEYLVYLAGVQYAYVAAFGESPIPVQVLGFLERAFSRFRSPHRDVFRGALQDYQKWEKSGRKAGSASGDQGDHTASGATGADSPLPPTASHARNHLSAL